VRNIRVFGSFARGGAGVDSDLDLLVDYVPGQSGFAFLRFCREAEELVGRKVDVAGVDGLHPLIRDRVFAEGGDSALKGGRRAERLCLTDALAAIDKVLASAVVK
jgi:predicted nucleotidyltransferase